MLEAGFAQGRVTLGCFGVGEGVYAIDVERVREIVRWQPVTPLPRAPALIEGVIDLRGAVVPVVDLGRVLRGVACEPASDTRLAIVEIDGLVMGLIVDAAIDVLAVEASSLEDPPALAIHAGYDATSAVVRRDGVGPVLVLSLEHILEAVHRSTRTDSGGTC
jgi:purine-binding chemotaxis protein CheW